MTRYAIFENPTALFQILGQLDLVYPTKVYQLDVEGPWAVGVAELNTTMEALNKAASAQNESFKVKNASALKWDLVSLLDVLARCWHPLSWVEPNTPVQEKGKDGKSNHTAESYLISTSSVEQAPPLLNALLTSYDEAADVKLMPIRGLLNGSKPGFFYEVSKLPPASALTRFEDTQLWHEIPLESSFAQIPTNRQSRLFLPCPHYLTIDPALLAKFDWLQERRIALDALDIDIKPTDTTDTEEWMVLLNPGEQYRRFVCVPKGESKPNWFDVAEFQTPTTLHADKSPKNDLHFKVNLRLVGREFTEEDAENRFAALENEVLEKQKYLEVLKEILPPSDVVYAPPEPLFMYIQRDPTKAIPGEIVDLLLQLSVIELKSVLHQRIELSALDEDRKPTTVFFHVVTTPPALGRKTASVLQNIAVRLRDYSPRDVDSLSFEMLPLWERYHLRLFVPMNRRLALFPAIKPSEPIARKLGEGLLGTGNNENPANWIFLLANSIGEPHTRQLQVVRLRISDFRPLIEAFNLDEDKLSLDVPPIRPAMAANAFPYPQKKATEYYANIYDETIKNALDATIRHKVRPYFEQWENDTQVVLDRHESRMNAISIRAESIEAAIQGTQAISNDVDGMLSEMEQQKISIRHDLNDIQAVLRGLRQRAVNLKPLLDQVIASQEAVQKVVEQANQINTLLQELPGWVDKMAFNIETKGSDLYAASDLLQNKLTNTLATLDTQLEQTTEGWTGLSRLIKVPLGFRWRHNPMLPLGALQHIMGTFRQQITSNVNEFNQQLARLNEFSPVLDRLRVAIRDLSQNNPPPAPETDSSTPETTVYIETHDYLTKLSETIQSSRSGLQHSNNLLNSLEKLLNQIEAILSTIEQQVN